MTEFSEFTDEKTRKFSVVWTSFGLGTMEPYDGELSSRLIDLIENYTYSKRAGTLSLNIRRDALRSDIALYSKFSNPAAKEIRIFMSDEGIKKTSLVFTVTDLVDYTLSDDNEYAIESPHSFFEFRATMAVVTY